MTEFIPCEPRLWMGRYRKPAGKESVYHVNTRDKIRLIWYKDDIRNECYVKESSAVRQLAKAINRVKRRYAGVPGGSFVINEYGQVITPIAGSRDRYLVGEIKGPLYFEHPEEDGRYLSLEGNGYKCGDTWDRPYLGIKYHLHRDDYIYFWEKGEEKSYGIEPEVHDKNLIRLLRKIRRTGPMSFVVNHHGVVITKKETLIDGWIPIYVGKINYDRWFEKEG